MTDENFYHLLRIPTNADSSVLIEALRRLEQELSAAVESGQLELQAARDYWVRASHAYEILSNPHSKAAYDQQHEKFDEESDILFTDDASHENVSLPSASDGQAVSSPESSARPMTATASILNAPRGVPGETSPARPLRSASGAFHSMSLSSKASLTPEKSALAQTAYTRAMKHHRAGDVETAIELFEMALANNNREPAYHARLAAAMVQSGVSSSRALELAMRAVELEPSNLDYRFILASVFESTNDLARARRIYEEILLWDRGNAQAIKALEALRPKPRSLFSGESEGRAKKGGFLKRFFNRKPKV